VVDHFDCPRDVVCVSMNFVDRYLCVSLLKANKDSMDKRQFKLLCLACLYLALKLEKPNLIPMDTLRALSRDIFTRSELVTMEQGVLRKLNWRLHPPTCFSFLECYALHVQGCMVPSPFMDYDVIVDSARFMIELSVIDYFFVSRRPSHVAIGALLNALDEDPVPFCHHWHSCFSLLLSAVDPTELPEILLCKSRLRAIHAKVTEPLPSTLPLPPAISPPFPGPAQSDTNEVDKQSSGMARVVLD
jgi:Cyclin, N-terminal domain/Cyclin, C-terminal domain